MRRQQPARTIAISRFLALEANPDLPALPHEALLDYSACKPDVYASIGVVATNLIDSVLKSELLERLQPHSNTIRINWEFRKAFDNQVPTILANHPERAREIGRYTHMYHGAQSNVNRGAAEELILAGIYTYHSMARALYERLQSLESSPSRQQVLASYRLLDKLAKLSVPMLHDYSALYLPHGYNQSLDSHVELARDGTGYQFKPRAILEAPAQPWRDVATIGELASDGPTIGCPVTFRPGTTRQLWELYVRARFGCEDNEKSAP